MAYGGKNTFENKYIDGPDSEEPETEPGIRESIPPQGNFRK
jgi:hypothetical protein